MFPSASNIGETIRNGLEEYEILEQLQSGKESTLFRVVCKSGRLRNRQLAVKKVLITPSSTSAKPHLTPTTSLHQALHHPNIVSLLSAFSTVKETFQVLELCSVGNLSQFLRARPLQTLQELELRGVTKSLADALTYLRKELVIHGDINPSSILLTTDYGVKLTNFKYSIRLPSKDSTTSSPCRASDYAAPEIASGGTYGFAADIWSLGCVMVYCLTGMAPFNTRSTLRMRQGVKQPCDLPEGLSGEVKELISSSLQIVPEERIYLSDILSHPFLASNMPVTSLRPISATSNTISQKSGNLLRLHDSHHLPPENQTTFQSDRAIRRTTRHASDRSSQSTRNKTRFVLGDVGNLNLRSMLRDETNKGKIFRSTEPTRRVVSDPISRRTHIPPPTDGLGSHGTNSRASPVQNNQTAPAPIIRSDLELNSQSMPYTPSFEAETKSSEATQVLHEKPALTYNSELKQVTKSKNFKEPVVEKTSSSNSNSKLPVGTVRPSPFNSLLTSCQTHKTTYGQVTILPSHSVLVDFRESQRRKGFKGNEVFVVNPDGTEISVYSAPHLSSPCCLIEPTQIFSIEHLPSVYWKQYNDAARLIDQIKQRTPLLVVYSAGAKCTLMANTPRGEIEVLFNVPPSLPNKLRSDIVPSLRLRFSRRIQSIEFARHVSDARGEEWTKKVIVSTLEPPYISTKDWKSLEQAEKDALHDLTRFVETCDVVEGLLMDNAATSSLIKSIPATDKDKGIIDPVKHQKPDHLQTPESSRSTSTIKSNISFLNVASRPSKLSVTARSTPDLTDTIQLVPQEFSTQEHDISAKRIPSDVNSAWHDDDLNETMGTRGIQTRFIPFVGWCIRYASRVSQGGRYRMMFLDGVALDIDVDEDWVEFKSQSGETTMHNIRNCGSNRKIGDRLKVFEEFVSMFDNSQEE